jgi:hypothetical protein
LGYVKELFAYLRKTYSKEQLSYVKIIQPENEAFQSYGDHGWTMSKDYLTTLALEGLKTFPDAKILMNSAGFFNIDPIIDLFKGWVTEYPWLKNRLIMGYDYYTDIGPVDAPIVDKFDPMNLPIVGQVDPLSWDESFGIFGNRFQKAREMKSEIGYEIVISEFEIAGGKREIMSTASVQYELLRVLRILGSENDDQQISLWGVENVLRDTESEKKGLYDVIRYVNPKTQEISLIRVPRANQYSFPYTFTQRRNR